MERTVVWLCALGVVALGVACSDDDRERAGGGGSVAIEDAPEALADAFCQRFERCLGNLVVLGLGSAKCAEEFRKTFEDGFFVEVDEAVERGTVEYHPEEMGTCLSILANASCDELNDRGQEECERALAGTVEEGGDCVIDAECKGAEYFCNENDACPGTCARRLGAGESCRGDDDCESGLSCSSSTGRCIRPVRAGERCEGGSEPECEAGLMCLGAEGGTPGTCRGFDDVFHGGLGESCSFDEGNLCRTDYFCALTELDGNEIVTECVAGATSGGSCRYAVPDMCPSNQYCDLTADDLREGILEATCVDLPAAGQPCAEPVAKSGCRPDQVCIGGTCTTRQRLGGSCTSDAACYSSSCQDGGCAPPAGCEGG